MLRKHYGLGIGPPPPRPVGSKSQDPMDMSESLFSQVISYYMLLLDSLAFDAKNYYEQLITTSSLPALLKRENELLSGKGTSLHLFTNVSLFPPEIRQLEGERQSLVYNHHHELIAASDTISAVSFPYKADSTQLNLLSR